jgi:hypothetical protein
MKKNIFSSYKRFTFISMFMFLIVAKIFAQLEITSHVPTGIINVGVNEQEFRLDVQNSFTTDLTNLAITINQPQGMVLNESSVSVEGKSISLNGNTVTITEPISVDETVTLTYSSSANCEAIHTLQSGGDEAALTNNYVIAANGHEPTFEITNSYNVKYPELYANLVTQPNLYVEYNQELARQVRVFNGDGAGITDMVRFNISYDDATILDLKRVTVSPTENRANEVEVVINSINDRNYYVEITSDILQQLGLGNTFNPNQSFFVNEYIKVIKNTQNHETFYQALFSDADNFCNIDANNSKAVHYLMQGTPTASVSRSFTIIEAPTECNRQGVAKITYTLGGNSDDILSTVLNFNNEFTTIESITINSIEYNGMPVTFPLSFDSDPDGEGVGFEDISGNGEYTDLKGGQSIEFFVYFTYPQQLSTSQISLTTSARDVRNIYIINSTQHSIDRFDVSSKNVYGDTDIVFERENAKAFFSASVTQHVNIRGASNRSSIMARATFPSSINIENANGGTVMPGYILFEGNIDGVGASFEYSLSCGVEETEAEIVWELLTKSTTCTQYSVLDSDTWTVKLHSEPCNVPSTGVGIGAGTGTQECFRMDKYPTLKIERTSLNIDNSSGINFYTLADLSTNIIDAENANVKAAYSGDKVRVELTNEVFVSNCQLDVVTATIFYEASENLFILESAQFLGQDVNISNVVHQPASSGQLGSFTFTLNNVTISEDNISLIANFEVNKDIVQDFHLVDYFKGYISAQLNSEYIETARLGSYFSVYKLQNISYIGISSSETEMCGAFSRFRIRANNSRIWGNEFRPISHLSQNIFIENVYGYTFERVSYSFSGTIYDADFDISNEGDILIYTQNLPLMGPQDYLEFHIYYKNDCDAPATRTSLIAQYVYSNYLFVDGADAPLFPNQANRTMLRNIPTVNLTSNSNVVGKERNVEWDVFVNVSSRSGIVWLGFENYDQNVGNIVVEEVSNGDVSYDVHIENGKYYVDLGILPIGQQALKVRASYTACQVDVTDRLLVTTGYACSEITNFSNVCNLNSTTTLNILYKTGDMQIEGYVSNPSQYNLMCSPIGYDIIIDATTEADIYDINFSYNSSNAELIGLHQNGLTYTLDGYIGSNNDLENGVQLEFDVYSAMGKHGLSQGSPINMHIDLTVECGEDGSADIGKRTITYFVDANNNCGDALKRIKEMRISIDGFENADSISIKQEVAGFDQRHGISMVSLEVENFSTVFIGDVIIQTELPEGINFVEGSTVGLNVQPIIVEVDGGKLIKWVLPSDTYLQAGEIINFDFAIEDATICPPANIELVSSAKLERIVAGCTSDCIVTGTSDQTSTTVSLHPVGKLSGLRENNNETFCSGDKLGFVVNAGENVTNYFWNIYPQSAGEVVNNGVRMSLFLNSEFSGNVLVSVYGSIDGCNMDTTSIDVRINPNPTVSIVCPTFETMPFTPVALTGGYPAGGVYSGTAVADGMFDFSLSEGANLDLVIYTYKDANGCEASDSCLIQNPPCSPTISLQADDVCVGDTLVVKLIANGIHPRCLYESYSLLSDFGGLNYVGFSVDSAIDNNQYTLVEEDFTYSFLNSGFYQENGELIRYYFVPNSAGEYNIEINDFYISNFGVLNTNLSVTVLENPSVSLYPISICDGGSGVLVPVSNASNTFNWILPNGSEADGSTLEVSENGIYEVVAISENGCTSSDTTLVSLFDVPSINISDTAFCEGSYITLDATTNGVAEYFWSNNPEGASITINEEGIYYLDIVTIDGCSVKDSINITVNPNPIAFNSNNVREMCFGGSRLIFANYEPNWNYIWSTGEDSHILRVTESGKYSITVTDSNNCVGIDTVEVIYNNPNLVLNSSDVCVGDTIIVNLDATNHIGRICQLESYSFSFLAEGLNFVSYSFDNSFQRQEAIHIEELGHSIYAYTTTDFLGGSGNLISLLFIANQSGSYSVEISDFMLGNMPIDMISTEVIVNPSHEIIIESASVCLGSEYIFEAVSSASGPYSWTMPNGTNVTSQNLVATLPGVYSVSTIDSVGCNSTDTAMFTINSIPLVSVNDTALCAGQSVEISAFTNENLSFEWSTNESTSSIIVTEAGTYTVSATNEFGCTGIDSSVVVFYEVPEIENDTINVCFTDDLVLDAGNYSSLLWNNGSTDRYLSIDSIGSFYVDVDTVTENGCSTTARILFSVHPSPNKTLYNANICVEESHQFTFSETVSAEPGHESYLWNIGGQSTAEIEVLRPPVREMTYIVTITNSYGCETIDSADISIITFNYIDMDGSGVPSQYDTDIIANILEYQGVLVPNPINRNPLYLFEYNSDSNVYLYQRTPETDTIEVSPCYEMQMDVDGIPGLSVHDFVFAARNFRTPELLPVHYSDVPRSSVRSKSIITNDNFNFRIEENRLIFSSNIHVISVSMHMLYDIESSEVEFGEIRALQNHILLNGRFPDRPEYQWANTSAQGQIGDLFSIEFEGVLPDSINVEFMYSVLTGAVSEDFTFYPYLMPCAPEISLEANDICLGDTLIVSLNLTGVHEDCEFSNYMFYTNFDGLEMSNYSIDYSSETTQELTIDGTSVYSILNDGVFEQTGELIRFIFVPNNSGEYNIEINDFLIGNSSLINSSLTVNVFDKPVISPLSDVTLCEGENAEIAIAATLSQTAQWTMPNGDVESVDTITVSIAGQYVVSLTENNCTATDTIAVIVNEKPEISSLSDITLCEGNNAEIGIAVTQSQTAQWTMPNGDVESVDTITVSIAGQYFVSLTENNCTATDTIAVIVNEKPEISSLSDVTLCEGENAEIGIAATQSQTAQWTMPNGDVESVDTITVSIAGQYFVSLTENNCTATDTIAVIVNEKPEILSLSDVTLCEGENAEIGIAVTLSQTAQWTMPNGDVESVDTITVSIAGQYFVSLTENNCTATDTIAVIVNEKPEISSLSDVTLCEGENAEIGIAATQSQTAQWTMPNGDVESEDIITVSTEGEYIFSLIENNCEATVKLQVVINPNPQVTLKDASLIEGESVELTPVATGSGLSFEWSDGSSTETITVTEVGVYSVTVTDNNQCVASASSTVSSSVNLFNTKKTKVSLYPVPAEKVLYVSANFTISAIEITTILGQSVVKENIIFDNKIEISVSNLSPALYNIKVYGTNGEFESLEFTKK